MCTHATEYYLALKRNEIVTDAITWMNLEVIVLREIIHKKTYITSFDVKYVD